MTPKDAALEMIEQGLSVIPIRAGTKKPCCEWQQFQSRIPIEGEVKAWFEMWSQAQLALVTGSISGVAAIDLDSEEAVKWAAQNLPKPGAYQKTARGYHLLYSSNGTCIPNKARIREGVDVRGDGGYILIDPSIHPEHKVAYKLTFNPTFDWSNLPAFPRDFLPQELDKGSTERKPVGFEPVPEGQRNEYLAKLAGRYFGKRLDYSETLTMCQEWNNRLEKPLSTDEVERTVQSIHKKHTAEQPLEQEQTTSLPVDPRAIQERAQQILQDREPCGSFDLSLIPPPIRQYIEQLCEQTEAEPLLVLTSVLGTLSALLGKRIYIPEGEYFDRLYPNIWTLTISPSGSFKTTALNKGSKLVWKREAEIQEKIKEEKNRKEELTGSNDTKNKQNIQGEIKGIGNRIAEIQAQSPIMPNRMSAEGLLELLSSGQGGLLPASEFGEWLDNLTKTFNQGLKPLFTDLFDVPQQYSYKTKGGGHMLIQRPYISICGFSSMAWVQDNISLADVGSGFFARFLLFYPSQRRGVPPALPQVQEPFDHRLQNEIEKRLDNISQDHAMSLAPDAVEIFEQIHQGIYEALEQCEEHDQELLAPYAKRWSPYILKLAMLFQATIDAGEKISGEAIKAGAAVTEYAINSTVYLFQEELGEGPFQHKCRTVLDFIAKRGGETSRRKLLISKRLDGGVKEYDEILTTLEQQGKIIINPDTSGIKKREKITLAPEVEKVEKG